VAVRLAGPPSAVAPQAQRAIEALASAQASAPAEVPDAETSLWPLVRDWPAVTGGSDSVMLRIGVAPSHVADVMTGVGSIASRHGLSATAMAYPGAATLYCSLSPAGNVAADAINGMIALVKEWNGNTVVERCPASLKEKAPVWGAATADELTRRVKTTFDPQSTLNPGRFVGGI
jgi:FAD/FMN-containing dehydrogenase